MKSQQPYPKAYSFEFFPPKNTEGEEKLRTVSQKLAELNPCFFSVTFGAGGSTRERTRGTVIDIKQHTAIDVAPHLSCIGSSRESIREILQSYIDSGIRHLVAIRNPDTRQPAKDTGDFAAISSFAELMPLE